MDPLTYAELRKINVERCEEVFHKLEDWSPTDWATAVAGEVGEACNLIKKLRRLDGADKAQDTLSRRMMLIERIAEELADVAIYLDLLAARFEIDLGAAVREKFNLVSRERGSKFLLPEMDFNDQPIGGATR